MVELKSLRNESESGVKEAAIVSRRDRGFTLIEVLVALLILGAGSLFLAQTIGQAVRLNQRSRSLTLAGFFAQKKMEEGFRDGYAAFKDGKNFQEGKGKGIYSRFRWQRRIVALSPPEACLREIIVTIFWKDVRAKRQIEFVSYMATGGKTVNER